MKNIELNTLVVPASRMIYRFKGGTAQTHFAAKEIAKLTPVVLFWEDGKFFARYQGDHEWHQPAACWL